MSRSRSLACIPAVVLGFSSLPVHAETLSLFRSADLSSGSAVGVSTGAGKVDILDNAGKKISASHLFSTDVTAEIAVHPNVKISGRLPITFYTNDKDAKADKTLLGNATLGARYVAPIDGPGDLAVKAGVGASVSGFTATSLDKPKNVTNLTDPAVMDYLRDAMTIGTAAMYSAATDPGRHAFETVAAGLDGDLAISSGKVFAQGQLGFRAYVPTGDEEDDKSNYLMRLGVGGGYEIVPGLAAIGELSTSARLNDVEKDEERFVHAMDLGLRYDHKHFSAAGRFTMPLDEVFRDSNIMGVGIDLAAKF
ncbi:MAG: hypothetical protein HY698_08685 [Deltaproteobacteria bacterium]|nr:hypothetical protein [Deltaproteobacteria bacterium]